MSRVLLVRPAYEQDDHLQRKVLQALGEEYTSFLRLESRTGMKREQLRLIFRQMVRKGWVQRANGLWEEDGEPFSCGYRLTEIGAAQLPKSDSA